MSSVVLPYPKGARRYRHLLAEVFGSGGREVSAVREQGDESADRPASRPDELELQARWFSGEFGSRFATPAGEPIEIVQFGHWNRSAGPDFTDAVVRVGDRKLRGSIEIDLDARDWEHHGHGANPVYDDVVLHLFLRLPEKVTFFTRNSSHREVAQAELDLGRFDLTRSVLGVVPEAKLGRCAAPLESMPEDRVATLLVAAAQYRLQRKARRFEAVETALGREQVLWLGVAEALGYRHNRLPMAVLAQRLPIARLRQHEPAQREALLFGAAGFIGGDAFDTSDAASARDYLRQLWDDWWKLRPDFELGPERALQWTLSGGRPLNHPQRRLAALGELAHRWPEFLAALPTDDDKKDEGSGASWVKALHQVLGALSHPFWSRHYTLRSKAAAKPMALIGRDRVHDLIGNVVVPIALRARPDLWEQFTALPASLDNESLRRARLRLFGRSEDLAAECSRRFFQQQALLQIFADFCLEDDSACGDCPFPEQLAQWG